MLWIAVSFLLVKSVSAMVPLSQAVAAGAKNVGRGISCIDSQCSVVTQTPLEASVHARIHSRRGRFFCAQCTARFPLLAGLRSHTQAHRAAVQSIAASWQQELADDAVFADDAALSADFESALEEFSVQGVQPSVYPKKCSDKRCWYAAKSAAHYYQHYRVCHQDPPRAFGCAYCSATFGSHKTKMKHQNRHPRSN